MPVCLSAAEVSPLSPAIQAIADLEYYVNSVHAPPASLGQYQSSALTEDQLIDIIQRQIIDCHADLRSKLKIVFVEGDDVDFPKVIQSLDTSCRFLAIMQKVIRGTHNRQVVAKKPPTAEGRIDGNTLWDRAPDHVSLTICMMELSETDNNFPFKLEDIALVSFLTGNATCELFDVQTTFFMMWAIERLNTETQQLVEGVPNNLKGNIIKHYTAKGITKDIAVYAFLFVLQGIDRWNGLHVEDPTRGIVAKFRSHGLEDPVPMYETDREGVDWVIRSIKRRLGIEKMQNDDSQKASAEVS